MRNLTVIKSAIFIVLVFALSACENNDKKDKLVVGVHSWPGGGIVYIGEKMGYFKEEGIELTIKKIENFDTKRAALIAGQIDIDVANTMDQLVIYNENSFPAQVIGITDESVGGDGLVVKNEIATIADLKGKTIAYAEASPSDFLLRYLLKQNSVPIDSVKLKPVADPQIAGNTIIAKQVDAAVTYEPFLSQATATEGLKLLASTKEYPTLIPGLLIADNSKIKSNSALYAKFLTAWFKSADYYYSHKPEAEKIIAEGMGMKVEEVKDILSVVAIQTKADNRKMIDPATKDNLMQLVKSISDFWILNGFTKKNANPDVLINKELIIAGEKSAN